MSRAKMPLFISRRTTPFGVERMETISMEGPSCVRVDKNILRVRKEGEEEEGKHTIAPDQRVRS